MANPQPIGVISSMATRQLLADLAARFEAESQRRVALEAIGGVDAAARVRAGEPFDVVVLARDVIESLIGDGRIRAGSRVDLVQSPVAIAIRAGAPRPAVGSAEELKEAVLAASTVGYSTGPSGSHIKKLIEQWGIAETLGGRVVVAPPGVPVGSLVASGAIGLGFQQLSELIDVAGIEVLGMLPPGTGCTTIFSGGIAQTSSRPDEARRLLDFMARPEVAGIKRRYGMDEA
jgi:molybdate transport system substrate-binding protein